MSTLPDKIKFDFDSWNIKIKERNRNRMKLQIKLDKDQSIAFKNFASVCKPDDVTDHDFIKTIFLTGVEAMNKELASLVQQYAKENKEELAASGITVLEDEDGKVQLAESHQFSGEPTVQDSVLHDDAIREVMDKEQIYV